MSARRIWTALALVLMLPFTAACASGGEAEPGAEGDAMVIRVDNTGTSAASLSVSIVPEQGVRQHLGTVTGTETFTYNAPETEVRFRLVGESTSGADIVSEPFTVTEPATVEWDVVMNSVTVTGR